MHLLGGCLGWLAPTARVSGLFAWAVALDMQRTACRVNLAAQRWCVSMLIVYLTMSAGTSTLVPNCLWQLADTAGSSALCDDSDQAGGAVKAVGWCSPYCHAQWHQPDVSLLGQEKI